MKQAFIGHWRITDMDAWDSEALDEEAPAHLIFLKGGSGRLHFLYVNADVDYRIVHRGDEPAIEFTFEGTQEMDPVFGRGWAVLAGTRLNGMLFIHQGDESSFSARRVDPKVGVGRRLTRHWS